MSSIEKLSIRGVRSFSPNREEVIEFYHPLTVILGDNGCGKTTIIECLKVACTGALPPGARSGQSFIHDPKIAGTNEVKASVRLRFRNQAGKVMVAQRTFQLQQTKTALKFKALDGVIRVINDLGEKVSMSHKCSELDRHIPEMLGVSKAVIESVIFCHQEESNWPLLEGAELKKRFDGIFESARYTKALEAIRKLKKARLDDTKDYKRDLDVLSTHMKQAQTIRDQIAETKEDLRIIKEEMIQGKETLVAAKEKHAKMKAVEDEITGLGASLREKQVSISAKSEAVDSAHDRIEQVMSDSNEELETLLQNYEGIVNAHAAEYEKLNSKEQALKTEEKHVQAAFAELQKSRGKLDERLRSREQQIDEFITVASRCGTEHGFYPQPLTLREDEITAFTSSFEATVDSKQHELANRETKNTQLDDDLAREVSGVESKLNHVGKQIDAHKAEVAKIVKKKRDLSAALQRLSVGGLPSAEAMQELERAIEDGKKLLDTFKGQHNLGVVKSELEALSRKLNGREYEVTSLKEKLKTMRDFQDEQTSIDLRRKGNRESKERFKSSTSLKLFELQDTLSASVITGDDMALALALESVDDLCKKRTTEREHLRQEVANAEQKLRDNAAALKVAEKALSKLNREKTDLEGGDIGNLKLFMQTLLPGEDLRNAEAGLQKAEKAYMDAKDKTLRCKNTVTFLSIFKQKGERDQCCPLCQRGMNSQEVEDFIRVVNEKTDDTKVKEKISRAEKQESDALKTWRDVDGLMPSWRKWMRLLSKLPESEQEVGDLKHLQGKLTASVDDAKQKIEASNDRAETALQARRQLQELLKTEEELAQAESKLDVDEARIQNDLKERFGDGAVSFKVVQAELDAKEIDERNERRDRDRKQEELTRLQNQLRQHEDVVRKKETEKNVLVEKRLKYEGVLKEQEQLRSREKEIRDGIVELESSLPTIKRELEEKKQEQSECRAQAKKEVDRLRRDQKRLETDLELVRASLSKVREYQREKLDEARKVLDDNLAKNQQRQDAVKQHLVALGPQMEHARQNFEEQEKFKKQILANLEYRDLKASLESLFAEEQQIKANISALPKLTAVFAQVESALADIDAAKRDLSLLEGRGEEMTSSIRRFKTHLFKEDLRDVDEKYRLKLIQFETTTMAVADLDKFYKALDESLLEYHSKKVEEINTIIRQLWQITYKGQDIDTIELVSGQQSDTASKASRSYDYRVVMRKAGAMIDMRGRCSAGQKVLAALVIRLALAETFCLNCGILALDEPTTNLDTENKYGLAQAITEYVSLRRYYGARFCSAVTTVFAARIALSTLAPVSRTSSSCASHTTKSLCRC
jgi:DNA repair protein RAD50